MKPQRLVEQNARISQFDGGPMQIRTLHNEGLIPSGLATNSVRVLFLGQNRTSHDLNPLCLLLCKLCCIVCCEAKVKHEL